MSLITKIAQFIIKFLFQMKKDNRKYNFEVFSRFSNRNSLVKQSQSLYI
ncbi:hypothetical protein WKT22_00359 [Candidatus Lokiarchaeum ossiferum]